MNNKERNKLIITVIAVLAIIAIVGGATYAYWTWTTSDAQKTNVTIRVGGGELNITGTNVTNTGMYPTTSCSGSAALKGSATVSAVNETSTNMTATLKIRASLYAAQGTLNSTNKGKLRWAIVDTTSTTSKTCSNPDFSGTFADVNHATSSASFPNTTYTDIATGITFTATAKTTTTKKYDIYVWLDSTYEHTNTGTTVSDPMQNLSISVKWSPASTLVQS